ncbi:type II secretion system protein GspL, partial [Oceanibaculum nanhaiense]|uniref:type II secretion system protein GspL n=1 Tax=Oceanibaculum nanhaiense TaxID=1909734 RepID=UPI00396EA1DB
MRETLLIRFTEYSTDDVDFVRLDAANRPQAPARRASLADANLEATGRRVVVLVPTADVLLARAKVPTQNRQRARKAAPFALEEQVAEDVETLHFALGACDADGLWPVAVAARARMDAWLAQLHDAGILPDRMLPEAVLLPLAAGSASLLLEDDRVLLRDQPGSAQSVPPSMLPSLLELLMARNEAGIALDVWHCGGELPVWMEPVSAKVESCADGALAVLARGLDQEGLPDLLQGAYSRKEQYGRLWRPWRAAAALLLVGVLVSAVQHGLHYRSLKAESVELKAQLEQAYTQTFPGGRVVNPRVQMEQQLNLLRRQQGGGGNDFLGLVGQLGGVIAATPGIELVGANFREGRLDLELTAADIQTLDRLKQQ